MVETLEGQEGSGVAPGVASGRAGVWIRAGHPIDTTLGAVLKSLKENSERQNLEMCYVLH